MLPKLQPKPVIKPDFGFESKKTQPSKWLMLKWMLTGAVTFAVCSFVFWSVVNFDVLVKAVRYPEAVRAMQIEVELISPLAKGE